MSDDSYSVREVDADRDVQMTGSMMRDGPQKSLIAAAALTLRRLSATTKFCCRDKV